jgi:hypothetical protein
MGDVLILFTDTFYINNNKKQHFNVTCVLLARAGDG